MDCGTFGWYPDVTSPPVVYLSDIDCGSHDDAVFLKEGMLGLAALCFPHLTETVEAAHHMLIHSFI